MHVLEQRHAFLWSVSHSAFLVVVSGTVIQPQSTLMRHPHHATKLQAETWRSEDEFNKRNSGEMVKCDFFIFNVSAVSERVGEMGNEEDGAVERDGSRWVNPKALTPRGFDAIFPRRESTWEELVNNICPGSGRLTQPPTPPQPQTLLSAVNHRTSHRSLHSGPGLPKLDSQPHPRARTTGPHEEPSQSKSIQSESVKGAILSSTHVFIRYTQTALRSNLHIRGRFQISDEDFVKSRKVCSMLQVAQQVQREHDDVTNVCLSARICLMSFPLITLT